MHMHITKAIPSMGFSEKLKVNTTNESLLTD